MFLIKHNSLAQIFGRFEDLLLLLDDHCKEQNSSEGPSLVCSKYNFIYLPMDYK